MNTSKPISTISYNSVDFLVSILDDLTKARKISFYAFIKHRGEDDEAGKKDHIHLYVEPSSRINTDELKDHFKEITADSEKPLGCLLFRSSKFDDWFLYSLHFSTYLKSKNLTKKYNYTYDQIITSSPDDLVYLSENIDYSALSPYANIKEAVDKDETFIDFIQKNAVPIQQVSCFYKVWELMGG